jgi:hypothetical protein
MRFAEDEAIGLVDVDALGSGGRGALEFTDKGWALVDGRKVEGELGRRDKGWVLVDGRKHEGGGVRLGRRDNVGPSATAE